MIGNFEKIFSSTLSPRSSISKNIQEKKFIVTKLDCISNHRFFKSSQVNGISNYMFFIKSSQYLSLFFFLTWPALAQVTWIGFTD